jgi:hypothetical protein
LPQCGPRQGKAHGRGGGGSGSSLELTKFQRMIILQINRYQIWLNTINFAFAQNCPCEMPTLKTRMQGKGSGGPLIIFLKLCVAGVYLEPDQTDTSSG